MEAAGHFRAVTRMVAPANARASQPGALGGEAAQDASLLQLKIKLRRLLKTTAVIRDVILVHVLVLVGPYPHQSNLATGLYICMYIMYP